MFSKKFRKIHRKTGLRPQACNFIKIETPTQVFFCEFREIFQNTFFTEHLWAPASARYIGSWYFHEIEMFWRNLN